MNFFLLSFSLKLQFVNFDFLFTGDFTLLEFVSPGRQLILLSVFLVLEEQIVESLSAVFEISSKVELNPTVPFNKFGGATRKLLFLKN